MSDYPDILNKGRRSVFPERLQLALDTFRNDLNSGRVSEGLVMLIVDQLSALPVETVARAEQELPVSAGLYRGTWDDIEYIPPKQIDLLRSVDGLEYVFLFHRNGYLREAALHKLDGAMPSAFFFAAVAYRLNDWVQPVRQAALECALRMFLETNSEIVTTAAMSLLMRRRLWTRGKAETIIIDEVFSRAEVLERFVERLLTTDQGPLGRILISALYDDRIDAYLPVLAQKARRADVRVVALRALVKEEARWPEGLEKKWIDKSMGQYRLAVRYNSRPLTVTEPVEALILAASMDRVATVRKVAMQALVDAPHLWRNMKSVVGRFAVDRSAAVRTGAEYILQHQPEIR